MFWKSIIEGLAILSHWQVGVATILYMAVYFAFLMILMIVTEVAEPTGCLFMIGGHCTSWNTNELNDNFPSSNSFR